MILASAVVLVRPASFGSDDETLASNAFQSQQFVDGSCEAARGEADALASALELAGVETLVVEEPSGLSLPNAVFPNNWFSTFPDGTFALYPMQAPNRRLERQLPALQALKAGWDVRRVWDLTGHESQGRFLEGTGSLVIDHSERIAFACVSPRTDRSLVESWVLETGYRAVIFEARDAAGRPVYHTNVVLALGDGFAVFGSDLVAPSERDAIRAALGSRLFIEPSAAQIEEFAANLLALRASDGSQVVAMSERAWRSLTRPQQSALESVARPVVVPLPIIEQSGGSARCMLAEIFLPLL